MIQFDEHIFQMGWFNHQLVYHNNHNDQPHVGNCTSPMDTWGELQPGLNLLARLNGASLGPLLPLYILDWWGVKVFSLSWVDPGWR